MKLRPDKHLHSREHVLAEDLSQTLCEPKRFAAYLGIAKSYDESDLRALAKYVSQKKELPPETRGKYFFGALRNLQRKNPILTVRDPNRKKIKTSPAHTDTKARRTRQI